MIIKDKKRLIVFLLCSVLLVIGILIETRSLTQLVASLFGGSKFNSIFDRIKFFLPIALIIFLSLDYVVYYIKFNYAYTLPRYNDKKKWFNKMIVNLFLLNLFIIVIFLVIGLMVGTILKVDTSSLFNKISILQLIIIYLLYNFITLFQIFLSIKYGEVITFIVIITLAILSTFINNVLNIILLLPIGMMVYHKTFLHSIFAIIFIIFISYIFYRIDLNIIKNIDLG